MGTDPKPADPKQRGISSFFKPTGDGGSAPKRDAAKENKRAAAPAVAKQGATAEVRRSALRPAAARVAHAPRRRHVHVAPAPVLCGGKPLTIVRTHMHGAPQAATDGHRLKRLKRAAEAAPAAAAQVGARARAAVQAPADQARSCPQGSGPPCSAPPARSHAEAGRLRRTRAAPHRLGATRPGPHAIRLQQTSLPYGMISSACFGSGFRIPPISISNAGGGGGA